MLNNFFFLIIFVFLFLGNFIPLYAQSPGNETLTISTYYPSPYGIYRSLRLNPSTQPVGFAQTNGTMYYDLTENMPKIYNGSAWMNMAGGGSEAPTGAVMFFNLPTCPAGWSELVAARGRYVVGLPSAGTLAGTAGTALTNQENRATGQHNHAVTDPGHTHTSATFPNIGGFWGPHFGIYMPAPTGYTLSSASSSATTGISIANTGVAGTNAPFIQLLVCEKQ